MRCFHLVAVLLCALLMSAASAARGGTQAGGGGRPPAGTGATTTYLECPGTARHGVRGQDGDMAWAPAADATLYVRIVRDQEGRIEVATSTASEREYRSFCDGLVHCFQFPDIGGMLVGIGGNESDLANARYRTLHINKATGVFDFGEDAMDVRGTKPGPDGQHSDGVLKQRDSIKQGVCQQRPTDPLPKKAVSF